MLKKAIRPVCALVVLTVMFVSTVSARSIHKKRTIESDGAKRIEVEFNFSAGDLKMSAIESAKVADLDIRYNDKHCDVTVDYSVRKKTGLLILESDHRKKTDLDTDDNSWVVDLSTQYPMTIDLDVGACEAEMELGSLQLEQLKIDVGAASCDLSFAKPNPIRMERFTVDAGASSLDITDIGNANFEQFELDGGVGSFDLDFRGTYTGESMIDIKIGLGSADITLPFDIPVRIEVDRAPLLSTVDFHRGNIDEIDDDVYESPNFDNADTRIILKIEVGLGSVDVTWRR